MKNIGLDLDGVLYNYPVAVYDYYRFYKGYDGTFNEFWTSFYKTLTDDDWTFLTGVDILYSSQFPTPECMDFLKKLSAEFDIYYVTSRPESILLSTEKYLVKYNFPNYGNLIFTKDKAVAARSASLDIFIDDMPKYIKQLSGVTFPIMLATPYNVEYQETYLTAHSLREAYIIIKEHTKESR